VTRKLFTIVCAVILIVGTAVAQSNEWPHLAAGVTTDFFNNQPLQSLYQNIRVEFSPVIQVGTGPNIYALPQIDYATSDGLVRIGGNVFVEVLTWGSWGFYTGASMSMPQFATTDVVKFNSQASAAIDVGGTRKIYTWNSSDGKEKAIRLGVAVRQEFSGQIGKDSPVISSPTRITTLKFGIIF
jgi:hypothetical protein